MSIHQLDIYGKDKVQTAIERFKTFEPMAGEDGYYLAFSGGKDSSVIKKLAEMSGVKFEAHYTLTSVDPPELVRFIKDEQPDVVIDIPRYPDNYKNPKLAGKQITMWNLIPEKRMPPTRIVRYCCSELKESRGEGRFVVTGVRKQESAKRSMRGGLELAEKKSHRMENYDPDNPDEGMIHNCMKWARKHLNPIIDWTTDEVWEFIREYNVPYCKLYDEGFKRLGCIGCPMGTIKAREQEFERYPTYKRAYTRAFQKMIDVRKDEGLDIMDWNNADDVNKWWIADPGTNKHPTEMNAEERMDYIQRVDMVDMYAPWIEVFKKELDKRAYEEYQDEVRKEYEYLHWDIR